MIDDDFDPQAAPPAAPVAARDPGATQTMQAWVRAVKHKKSISGEVHKALGPVIEQFRLPSARRRVRTDPPD